MTDATESTEPKLAPAVYSFDWGDNDFVDIATAAEVELEKEQKDSQTPYVPTAFLTEGRYSIRIWPDRDANGRPRIMRQEFIHRLPDMRPVLSNDVVTKLIDDATEAGVKRGIWKYYAQRIGLMMVHVYECPKDNDYIKPGRDICLRLTDREITALNQFLSNLKNTDKLELLDPRKPNLPITLTISGSFQKEQVHVGLDALTKPVELPPMTLPEGVEWTGLDTIYITKNDVLSEEGLAKFRKVIAEAVLESQHTGTNVDPSRSSETAGHQIAQSVAAAPQSTASASSSCEKCSLVTKCLTDPSLAAKFSSAKFGNMPGVGSDDPELQSLECYICEFSSECEKLTKDSK